MDIKTIKNQPDPSIRTLVFLYKQSEKMEIIRLVGKSELSIKKTLQELVINHSNFYSWYNRYLECGEAVLRTRSTGAFC